MFWIIGWIFFGTLVGLIARALVPGEQPLGLFKTMLLGVAGSFCRRSAGIFISRWFVDSVQRMDWLRHWCHAANRIAELPPAEVIRGRPRKSNSPMGSVANKYKHDAPASESRNRKSPLVSALFANASFADSFAAFSTLLPLSEAASFCKISKSHSCNVAKVVKTFVLCPATSI